MKTSGCLIDTGPLIGFLVKDDYAHERAVALLERAPRPWSTCESVLSEAVFLLGRARARPDSLLALLEREALLIDYSARGQERELSRLLRKYADVPMSVADASLVRMSELNPRALLVTFDNDFSLYRRADRRAVTQLR